MNEILDIHNFDKRLDHIQNKIMNDPSIKQSNKRHITKFIDFCFVSNMKKSSIAKDLYSLWFVSHNLNKDFMKATKDDFNKVIKLIEQHKWSEWTKRNHRVALKKLMKWLKGENKFYPPEVEDISTDRKRLKSFLPEDILTTEEVEKMINSADNIRDKTFIMFLAFTGARIGEALNVKLKHVRFQDTGEVIVMLMGKTGYRTVVSIPLSPQLSNYIENGHSGKDNPDSFLWLTKYNMFGGRKIVGKRYSKRLGKEVEIGKNSYVPLTYAGALKILRKLADRADIKKKVSPHWFRRYSATEDSKYMSDRLMMLKYGWSTPEVVGVYSKLSSQSLIETERKRHGKLTDDGKPKLTILTCPRCKLDNPPVSKFCSKCSMVLDMKTALEMERKEKEFLKMISPEMIESMIEKKVQEMMKK